MLKVKKDLTGMRFGKLTVTRQSENDKVFPSGKRAAKWYCDCDCGTKDFEANGWYLMKGDTTSCGCIVPEIARQNGKTWSKKYCTYDLTSCEYGIGYTQKGEEFWFDKEDYDKIKNYCWSYHQTYLVAKEEDSKKIVRLHRLVMGAKDNEVVDHIYHPKKNENKFDNRKCNLRIGNDQTNAMNRHINSNNTSGVTGVHWHEGKQKWEASIYYKGKNIYLGSSTDKEQTIKWRKDAERKYFGDYRIDVSYDVMKQNEEKGA